jgi:predicted enzyme related to lactoylglutathione lyase
MLGKDPVVAFVATKDGAKARRFYEQVLELRLVSDEPWAIVFDAAGTTIRIQKLEAFTPQPFTALGWNVADIAATVKELARRDVRFERYPGMEQDDAGVWRSPSGARVAWFKDPDGNTLSITQL